MAHAYSWIYDKDHVMCGLELGPHIYPADIHRELSLIDCVPCLHKLCKYLQDGWTNAAKAHDDCGACDDD